MKLIINRDQDKGFFGGISFVLRAKVILTAEEQALITKYKANKEVLYSSGSERKYTIADLVAGVEDKVKDVTILQKNEEVYKDACSYLKSLLAIMASFGGQEVFEF